MIHKNQVLQAWKKANRKWKKINEIAQYLGDKRVANEKREHFEIMRNVYFEQTSSRIALKFKYLRQLKKFCRIQQRMANHRQPKIEMMNYKTSKRILSSIWLVFKKRISCSKNAKSLTTKTKKLVISKILRHMRTKTFELQNLS